MVKHRIPHFSFQEEDIAMKEREIDQIATKIVAQLMKPENRNALAEAIAHALRECETHYRGDIARLGERLDLSYPSGP